MSDFVVIGVDPGKLTGVFVYRTKNGYPQATGAWIGHQVSVSDMPLFMNRKLRSAVKSVGPDNVHVAIEKFIITARTAKLSQQTDALEVTGEVKALAMLNGVTDVRQYLKANLRYANDDALKRAYWWATRERHANDAARQAYALLKDVDYPTWLAVSNGAMMKIDDKMKGQG
jgi:hypothetical protein